MDYQWHHAKVRSMYSVYFFIYIYILPSIKKWNCRSNETVFFLSNDVWVEIFMNGPSKICGRQPLKNTKQRGLLRLTTSLQIF